jgi:hypothetical protein
LFLAGWLSMIELEVLWLPMWGLEILRIYMAASRRYVGALWYIHIFYFGRD